MTIALLLSQLPSLDTDYATTDGYKTARNRFPSVWDIPLRFLRTSYRFSFPYARSSQRQSHLDVGSSRLHHSNLHHTS